MSIVVKIYDGGQLAETVELEKAGYLVLCAHDGPNAHSVTHEQHYLKSGTVQLTIKRDRSSIAPKSQPERGAEGEAPSTERS